MEIIEFCDTEELLKREQYYLDNLKPQYNIVESAGSTLGYKHTPESLQKMRDFVLSAEVMERKMLATANATALWLSFCYNFLCIVKATLKTGGWK